MITIVRLTQRLQRIASLVPRGAVVADIGTDHAFLPMYLVQEDVCPRVIATEVRAGPLRRAGANLAGFPGRARIQLRGGDGLAALAPGEADTVVIAGMGGRTIRDILTGGAAQLAAGPLLLLAPNSGVRGLRTWLYNQGWHLLAEHLIMEKGRFYIILAAAPGSGEIADPLDLAIGPGLIAGRDELLPAYLARMAGRLTGVRARLAKSPSRSAGEKAAEVDRLLKRIGELQRWLSGAGI